MLSPDKKLSTEPNDERRYSLAPIVQMHLLAAVIRFLENTRARPVMDRTFALKDAAAAQRRLEEGKQFGKIVLEMDG